MVNNVFDIDEHKIGNDEVVKVLKQIDVHCKTTSECLVDVKKSVNQLLGAFPSGDLEGHKRYHDLMIETLAERRRMRVAIQEKTISGLIWAIIVGIGLALWHQLLTMLGRSPV